MRSLSRILDISCLCPYHHLYGSVCTCIYRFLCRYQHTCHSFLCCSLSLSMRLYSFFPICFLPLFISPPLSLSEFIFSFYFSRLINHSHFLLLFFSDRLLYLLHHVWLCLSLSIFFLCRLLRFHSLLPSLLSKSLYLYLFLFLFVRSLSMPMTASVLPLSQFVVGIFFLFLLSLSFSFFRSSYLFHPFFTYKSFRSSLFVFLPLPPSFSPFPWLIFLSGGTVLTEWPNPLSHGSAACASFFTLSWAFLFVSLCVILLPSLLTICARVSVRVCKWVCACLCVRVCECVCVSACVCAETWPGLGREAKAAQEWMDLVECDSGLEWMREESLKRVFSADHQKNCTTCQHKKKRNIRLNRFFFDRESSVTPDNKPGHKKNFYLLRQLLLKTQILLQWTALTRGTNENSLFMAYRLLSSDLSDLFFFGGGEGAA